MIKKPLTFPELYSRLKTSKTCKNTIRWKCYINNLLGDENHLACDDLCPFNKKYPNCEVHFTITTREPILKQIVKEFPSVILEETKHIELKNIDKL